MKQHYLRFLSILVYFGLCLHFFAAPNTAQAGHFSSGSEDSVLAINRTNVLKHKNGTPDVLQLAQSKEITISIEKSTSSIEEKSPAEKINAESDAEGEDFDQSFDSLEDPFAEETPAHPPIDDPYESYNRFMFKVNDNVYTYAIKPVATGYAKVVPVPVRVAIKNLFENVRSPVNFVSSVIQGDMDKTGRVLSRLLINTTIGLGGLFDVAKNQFDIQPVNEDFDQALGYHGVPTGPYVVLPLLGPSSGRNALASVVDTLLNPVAFVSPSFVVGTGITATNITNKASFNLDAYEDLKNSTVDPYSSLRDFNHQHRENLIRE